MEGQQHVFSELVEHLERTTALSRAEAVRVVADVLAYFSEPATDFVRRRHRELQRRNLTNQRIFELISEELKLRRVAAPELSHRQIRRMVYG